jgi:hypothetical protein
MKICLSGIIREEHLQNILKSSVSDIVLDFSVAKNLSRSWFEEHRSRFDCLMLEYDLNSSWSRLKYLWGTEDARVLKAIHKHGSLESAQEHSLARLDKRVREYLDFCKDIEDLVDVIWLPYLPTLGSVRWEKLLKSTKIGYSLSSFEELDKVIHQYSYLGIPNRFDTKVIKAEMTPYIASLRSFGIKTHVWGRVDKQTLISGLLWSGATANWLSGTKYGVTFEYVGNLKLVTYHASKGVGKQARTKLKAKCGTLSLDHSLLMSDDRSSLATSSQFGSYLRTCNSCYLSANCPAFEPDQNCKLSSTPKVDTPEDIQNLINKVIQIQGERVLFASISEKMQNAGLNPEVSSEMETLTKLMKDAREIASPVGGDEVFIKAKGSGVISRLFGGYGRSGGGTKPSTSERIIDVSPMESEDD